MESKGKKLFGKVFKNRDRSRSNDDDEGGAGSNKNDLSSFFGNTGSGDRLPTHPPPLPPPGSGPPILPKLNTSHSTRYANAHDASVTTAKYQGTPIPRRNKGRKNLTVRFVETYPDVIGEGGDESDIPTIEISQRKRSRGQSAPVLPPPSISYIKGFPDNRGNGSLVEKQESPAPSPGLRRAPTGKVDHIRTAPTTAPAQPARNARSLSVRDTTTKNEQRRSFIEIHQAEMREAEGMAFAKAHRDAGPANHDREWEESNAIMSSPPAAQSAGPTNPATSDPPPPLTRKPLPQDTLVRRPSLEQSPASVHSVSSLSHSNSRYYRTGNGSPPSPTKTSSPRPAPKKVPTFGFHDVVSAASDDALNTFKSRVRHLSELFRLHSEKSRPLSTCTPEDLVRGALWWFLKGRMGVETAIRERPSSPETQMRHEMAKQQAFTDLAKVCWMLEEIFNEVTGGKWSPTDTETGETRRALQSNLRKLTMSMKRNEFMPPEEPFLPQTVDKTIWVDYPSVPQDLLALLSGFGSSSFAPQRPNTHMEMLDALPIGDTTQFFNFSRISTDVYLTERDSNDSNRFYFPCLLSTIRPQKQSNLVFVVASQNGAVQLRIQGNKNLGPVWDDVTWRNDTCALEIKLPRGFMVIVQCSQADYRMLLGMYDFGNKIQSTLFPRPDEQVLFRSSLRAFQYFDADPQSRVFPKDAVLACEVGLFEKLHKENSPTGLRTYHTGYRVAVMTGPRTRTLSGVNHVYPPTHPIQFGFLRGEKDDPALVLRFESSRSKGRMVFTFNDDKERFRFHNLLTGTAIHHDEQIFSEGTLAGFAVGQRITDNLGITGFNHLNYRRARVVNDENGGDEPQTILADRLRVVVDFENGTIIDRINVGPGELRLRLDPRVPTALLLYRPPQNDMTVGIADGQTSKETARELIQGLSELEKAPSVRSLRFSNIKEVHSFERALTGFEVLFDGIVTAFAIARRRMVVPIHKKWEAGETRIQVVQQDTQLQLLAFFEDFSHGHCMNFVLKGTDIYECSSRSGKSVLKIIDAKFPLPRMTESAGEEAAFVCLDSPDYASEHDDISIIFEKDTDRERLVQCLPASVKGSRLR